MAKPKKTVIEYRNYELPINFPILLLSGDRWHISDVPSGKLHFHNCLEIGICLSDSGYMEYDGTKHLFRAGDVTVISRNIPHTTYSTKGTASLWSYLFVEPNDLLRGYFTDSFPNYAIFKDLQENARMILNREEHPDIYHYVTSIIREMEGKKLNYQFAVKGLFLALSMALMRVYAANVPVAQIKEEGAENALVISPALDYIRDNYMQNFPIEDLADMCHLSQTHFRRVFHEIMNTSPLDYLNTTRILESCALLRTTEDSILEVSERVGFRSISSYNRHFAEIMGTQPSEWRRKMNASDNTSILEYSGWMAAQELKE